jgi:diaminopimelate epimerase
MKENHIGVGGHKAEVAEGADQGAFNQWDSVIKVLILDRVMKERGIPLRIVHGGHAVDVLGRNPSRAKGVSGVEIIDERYTSRHAPGWFAGVDAMPAFTLLAESPHTFEEYLGGKKFRVALEGMLKILRNNTPLVQSMPDLLRTHDLPTEVPTDLDAFYAALTKGTWRGAVNEGTTSIGAMATVDVQKATRGLMQFLTTSVAHMLEPAERSSFFERARELLFSSAVKTDTDKTASLTVGTERIFKDITASIAPDSTVDWADTWNAFDVPRDGVIGLEQKKNFKIFEWYIRHRREFEDAFIHSAKTVGGEQQILPLDVGKGETPFWLIVDGQRFKLFMTDTALTFGPHTVPLDTPISDLSDIARTVFNGLPQVKNLKLAPSAIPLSIQWMSRSHYTLPEGGSTYVPQVDALLASLVNNRSLTLKDLKDIIPQSRIRVHPHALSALPDSQRFVLPWYLRHFFEHISTVRESGTIDGQTIKSTWEPTVSAQEKVLAELKGKSIIEMARMLFPKSEEVARLIETVQAVAAADAQKESAKDRLVLLENKLKAEISSDPDLDKSSRDKKKKGLEMAIGQFVSGRADSVSAVTEPQDLALLKELRPIFEAHGRVREAGAQSEAILYVMVLQKIRGIQGGIDALEHWDRRPSLLTTYLLAGKPGVDALIMHNKDAEVTYEVPHLPDGSVEWSSVHGNKLMLYEDRSGKFVDGITDSFRLKLVDQLRANKGDSLIVLVPPLSEEADCRMLVLEKDGTQSVMCGNGVAAVMDFYARRYGKKEITIESIQGEFVRASVRNASRDDAVNVDMKYPIDIEKASEHIEYIGTPSSRMQMPILGIRVAGGEPHVVREVFEEHLFDEKHIKTLIPFVREVVDAKNASGKFIFPDGINVTFVVRKPEGIATYRTATFERGINAFTQSCGTGTLCAASCVHFDKKRNERAHMLTLSGRSIHVEKVGDDIRLETTPRALGEQPVA